MRCDFSEVAAISHLAEFQAFSFGKGFALERAVFLTVLHDQGAVSEQSASARVGAELMVRPDQIR
jgi:hypothetical protein